MALSPETRRRIREELPSFSYLLDIPEVANLLGKAVEQGWDQNKLMSNLYATHWWRRHSETSRNWSTLVATDPAEANRRRQEMWQRVGDLFRRFGVKERRYDVMRVAESALKRGWTDAQITHEVVRFSRYRPKTQTGELRRYGQEMRALAKQYGLTVSSRQTQKWARGLATGRQSEDSIQAWMRGKALQSLDPQGKNLVLRRGLDMGLTVRDIYSGVIETVANELEIDDSRIDLSEGRWKNLVHYRDEEGNQRPMTETEATRWARSQDSWQQTNGAKESYAGLANAITTRWGIRR